MATPLSVPVSMEVYLSTVYRPDCEYVDGLLEERHLGEKEHSRVQGNLIFLLRNQFRGTAFRVWPEWRFQTRPQRFRVPDLVVTDGEPAGDILREVPLLCIEILSPEDRWARVTTRIQEYLDFGVPEVWVIDPAERAVWICQPGTTARASDPLLLSHTGGQLSFTEIFE